MKPETERGAKENTGGTCGSVEGLGKMEWDGAIRTGSQEEITALRPEQRSSWSREKYPDPPRGAEARGAEACRSQ